MSLIQTEQIFLRVVIQSAEVVSETKRELELAISALDVVFHDTMQAVQAEAR